MVFIRVLIKEDAEVLLLFVNEPQLKVFIVTWE